MGSPFGPPAGAPFPPLFAVHSEIQTRPVKPQPVKLFAGLARGLKGSAWDVGSQDSEICHMGIWYGYTVCVLTNHKRAFSVSMSHSNLATQWEAVGTLRDKARKLELAPSL